LVIIIYFLLIDVNLCLLGEFLFVQIDTICLW